MFDLELNDLGFLEEQLPDKEELREQVSMYDLLTYLGMEWNPHHDKIRCPFHSGGKERTPSMQVHDNVVYCFGGCKRTWDIFQFVMDYMQLDFVESLRWLYNNMGALPKGEKKEIRIRAEYKGPVPLELIRFYQSCLKEEQRQWLRDNRLLTDETIESTGIGWRPDWKAYAFPYWRGKPFESQADILQFRATAESPRFHDDTWHYIGLKGHNRPSVINGHRAAHAAIIVFGTLDSYLGCQDGLAMLSINGIAVMLNDSEALDRLAKMLEHTQYIFIVPDNQANEAEPAYTLARQLNDRLGEGRAYVRLYPRGEVAKDYTEYRQSGKTAWDFICEVIMTRKKVNPNTSTPWDSPFLNDPGQREWTTGILKYMADGDWDRAETYLGCLQSAPASPMIVNHALQMKAGFAPFEAMTREQWEVFREELAILGVNSRYEDLFRIVKKWAEEQYANNGGF